MPPLLRVVRVPLSLPQPLVLGLALRDLVARSARCLHFPIGDLLSEASPPDDVLSAPDVIADPALDLRERHSGFGASVVANVVHNGKGTANAG